MNTFIKIFHCCNQEENKKAQDNSEFNVPINTEKNKNNNITHKNTENNNTVNTIINTNNSRNNIIDRNSDNINNKINNNNINNNINKENILKDEPKISFSPSKKRIIYSNSISHNHFNINKMINNNSLERNKSLNSRFSKSNASKNNISNKGSILTLNNLILINQNQEEKRNELGSKLLLSGELFFWKDIIITSNGIKNSLKTDKNDHVSFGIKIISNKSGEPYNDFLINFFYHQNDAKLIETNTGTIFEIFYNKKINEYIFHFLHPNLIVYYKINNFVYFDIGKIYYFLLGNVLLSINVKKISPIEKIINIIIEIENNKPINYSFNQNQTPIKIGRINSEINIFNSSISKIHGVIEYSKNSQTFYYKDMGSSNGSTLIIKAGDTLKIKGEMNFKLEDVPFKIQEIP